MESFVLIVVAIHAAAVAVVNLTGTPDASTPWGKAYRVIEWAAGLVTEKAKDRGGPTLRG